MQGHERSVLVGEPKLWRHSESLWAGATTRTSRQPRARPARGANRKSVTRSDLVAEGGLGSRKVRRPCARDSYPVEGPRRPAGAPRTASPLAVMRLAT